MLFTIDSPFKDKDELSERQEEQIEFVRKIADNLEQNIRDGKIIKMNYEMDVNTYRGIHNEQNYGNKFHTMEWVVE